jgi:hypothetical protein
MAKASKRYKRYALMSLLLSRGVLMRQIGGGGVYGRCETSSDKGALTCQQ